MLTIGSIDLKPFPKLELDRIPERRTISEHLPTHGLHRLMRRRIVAGQGEHHRFRQRPMAVAIQNNVALEVPAQRRTGQLQHGQAIEQPAKQIGNQ